MKDSKKRKSKMVKKSNKSKSEAIASKTTEVHRRGRSTVSKERNTKAVKGKALPPRREAILGAGIIPMIRAT